MVPDREYSSCCAWWLCRASYGGSHWPDQRARPSDHGSYSYEADPPPKRAAAGIERNTGRVERAYTVVLTHTKHHTKPYHNAEVV